VFFSPVDLRFRTSGTLLSALAIDHVVVCPSAPYYCSADHSLHSEDVIPYHESCLTRQTRHGFAALQCWPCRSICGFLRSDEIAFVHSETRFDLSFHYHFGNEKIDKVNPTSLLSCETNEIIVQ
jgi:hypothetical protein